MMDSAGVLPSIVWTELLGRDAIQREKYLFQFPLLLLIFVPLILPLLLLSYIHIRPILLRNRELSRLLF